MKDMINTGYPSVASGGWCYDSSGTSRACKHGAAVIEDMRAWCNEKLVGAVFEHPKSPPLIGEARKNEALFRHCLYAYCKDRGVE